MARKLCACLLGASLCHAVREQVDSVEDLLEAEENRWLPSRGEKCEKSVPGSVNSRFNWVRYRRCKCPKGQALDGPEEFCGDGTRTLFRPSKAKGKGCICQSLQQCTDVNTQPNFNIEAYISKRWYAQEQMLTRYLPANANNCVTAKYTVRDKKTFWGYSLKVQNNAKFDDGKPRGGELCAYSANKSDKAKLAVAPCFLPRLWAGPYWVLRFNQEKGYALISGGQPKVQTVKGCRTNKGTNNAGLWIFTHEAIPAAGLVDEVREIAAQWFDLSVLVKVNHTGCTGVGYGAEE